MSQQKDDKNNAHDEETNDYSFINDPNHSKIERIALVRSMTDRLQLTLDHIRDPVANQEKIDLLNIIPPDLIPFEINLSDGEKITVMNTNPVVTCYDGELSKPEGNVIHILVKKPEEELPEDFLPPRKMFRLQRETFETELQEIIQNLMFSSTKNHELVDDPSTSKKLDTPSNTGNEERKELTEQSVQNTIEEAIPYLIDPNVERKLFQPKTEENISFKENHETPSPETKNEPFKEDQETPLYKTRIKQNEPIIGNDSSKYSPRFQVLGLIDTGISRDTSSEDGFYETGNEGFEPNDKQDIVTIMVDKELDPAAFRSAFLETLSSSPKKNETRKSTRIRKPKISSAFESWDDIKIRLPKPKRKKRSSYGSQSKTSRAKNKNKSKN